jgi:hypothetical protein
MRLKKTVCVTLAALAALGIIFATGSMSEAQTVASRIDWQKHALGPTSFVSVYWVGHSLVESKAETEEGPIDLMSIVGSFASVRGLVYRMGDHTLWGSPLSALWRGRPHSYHRDASIMVEKRRAFEREAAGYNALVLTEGLPLRPSLKVEFSSYYLRRFYCVLKQANPSARVYLYQTWVNLQGADPYANYPPADRFDWRSEMIAQRALWEELADTATRPRVRAPGWLSSLGFPSATDAGCSTEDSIFIIPVGNTFVALADRLSQPRPGDHFERPDGSKLKLADLFSNPYVDWPEDWPVRDGSSDVDSAARLTGLRLHDPSKRHDDIHPSAIGIYVSALVHFATLYRQTPVGLPYPASVGEGLARTLQCIAWETVVGDPRSGVAGEVGC